MAKDFTKAIYQTQFSAYSDPDVFSDTATNVPATGKVWCAVHIIVATTFVSFKRSGAAVASLQSIALPADMWLYGNITECDASAGTYECYYLAPAQ